MLSSIDLMIGIYNHFAGVALYVSTRKTAAYA